jgi:endonuclease/exonuclease/phosphatase family metal-dependent hydrolase
LTAASQSSLRIVSYNVHACVGRDGRFRPERIAAVMESLDADFFALQEVEDRQFEGSTVSCFLATRLAMHAYRGVTMRREDSAYGNLLLARPEAQGHRLRGCIEADFVIGDQRLRLFATHLGLRAGERQKQVRQLTRSLKKDDADVRILAGDINEWRPGGRVLRALQRVFGPHPSKRTFPSNRPAVALDRIYVSPTHAITDLRTVTTAECRVASDHLPVVCDVILAASR